MFAAMALGRLEDQRAVEPLLGTLNDPNGSVREKAAWALGCIGYARARSALQTARNDK